VVEAQRERAARQHDDDRDDDDDDDHGAQARAGTSRVPYTSSSSRSLIRWLTTRLDPPGGIDTP
jgi:hypothetical protein